MATLTIVLHEPSDDGYGRKGITAYGVDLSAARHVKAQAAAGKGVDITTPTGTRHIPAGDIADVLISD